MTPQQSDINVPTPTAVENLKQQLQQTSTITTTTSTENTVTNQTNNGNNSPTLSIKTNNNNYINQQQLQQQKQHVQQQSGHLKTNNKNDNKFLERVLAVMNSSQQNPARSAAKPPLPPTISIHKNGGLTNGGLTNGGLTNGGSYIVEKNNFTNASRPPLKRLVIDKQVQQQQQQQQQQQLPQLSEGRVPASRSYVLEPQHENHYINENSSKLLSQNHQRNPYPSVNGYAGANVSLTSRPSVAGNVDNFDISNNNDNKNTINKHFEIIDNNDYLVYETPIVAASLKLPLSTTEKMSANAKTTKYEINGIKLAKPPLPSPITATTTTTTTTTGTTNGENRRNSYILTRSPSPTGSSSSRCSSISSNITSNSRSSNNFSFSRLQTPPRRVFPQTYTRGTNAMDVYEMKKLESSPVVFDANLSFVLGCKRQPVHQSVRASPSHMDNSTSSAYLSEKIQNFLKRTDHVQEEWSAMGRRSRRTGSSTDSRCTTPTNSVYDNYDTISLIERQRERKSMERDTSIGRSRSSQNILTKAFQLSKTLPSTPISRSNSMARDFSESEDDRTIHEEEDRDLDEVKH